MVAPTFIGETTHKSESTDGSLPCAHGLDRMAPLDFITNIVKDDFWFIGTSNGVFADIHHKYGEPF